MFKDISSADRSIKEFKTYKQFTFTHSDSGSGVFGLEGISGSFWNFQTGSAASQSFGVYNEDSKSFGKTWDTWYSCGTFFKLPLYYQIRNCYYQYDIIPNPKSTTTRFPIYSAGNWSRKHPHGREDWPSWSLPRELHDTVNVITVPQEYFGEEIKPYSVKILDDSSDITIDLRDDGYGQLYDYAYSSSFAAGVLTGRSGSTIGNVFYEHGIVTITNTGSAYTNIGLGTGGDGWSIRFQATKTSYEYSYLCSVDEYQFTGTTNPSTTVGRSGSITIPPHARYNYTGNFDNPQYENTIDLVLPPASSSYALSYNGSGSEYQNFTTHSEFGTYVTNIGLYNDTNELLAIAKLSNPVKNDKDLPISFLVRFDS